jgi:hypothetical protein
MYHLLDSVFFSILYPVLLVGSVFLGFYVAEKKYKQRQREWKPSGSEAAMIGLFGLLLSFTFLSSGNAFRERSGNIHSESDGVADLRRQSLFVSDSLKQMTKDYLIKYLDRQVDFSKAYKRDHNGFRQAVSEINGDYLTKLVAYGKRSENHHREAQILLPYFNKLNSMFYRNLYSFTERVPLPVLLLLIIGSVLTGILVGFMNGFHQHRHYLVPLIFVVLVVLSIGAILDMNNPSRGGIRPSYEDFKYQKELLEKSTR